MNLTSEPTLAPINSGTEPTGEIAALLETLRATKQRLEELTLRELDVDVCRAAQAIRWQHGANTLPANEIKMPAAVLDALPVNIALLDATGMIISVNASWRAFADNNQLSAPNHGVGLNYLDICERAQGDDMVAARQVASGIRAVLQGCEPGFSFEYACHSPTEQRWFAMTVTPLEAGCPGRVVVMHRNVTERKTTELRLLEALAEGQRFRAALDQVSAYIYMKDAESRYIYANQRTLELFGCSAEELRGRKDHCFFPPATAQRLREVDLRVLQGEHTNEEIEVAAGPGGRRVYLEVKTPLYAESGARTIVGLMGVSTDITDRKQAQAELDAIQQQLVTASRLSGMAEVATNVLHNVGNVLNSVNVSTGLIAASVKQSKIARLGQVADLLREHAADLVGFLAQDTKGKQLPDYLARLADHLLAEQVGLIGELESLQRNVDHIKEIVATQQSYARFGGVKEMVDVVELVEDSLRINESAINRQQVEIVREFEPTPPLNIEKHKVLQILVNLIRNAKHACQDAGRPDQRLTVRVAHEAGQIKISVADNGVGIAPENLTRIFQHGFTTRKDGHGFGLHSGALAAQEMGGTLTVHSAGPGAGACFTLTVPIRATQDCHD
jgi:PAS domain S-box-containing protein